MAVVKSFASRLPSYVRIPPGWLDFDPEARDEQAYFSPKYWDDNPWTRWDWDGLLYERPTEAKYRQHYSMRWNLDIGHADLTAILQVFFDDIRSAVGDTTSIVSQIRLKTTARLIRSDCDIPACMDLVAASLAMTRPPRKSYHFSLRKSSHRHHGFCTIENEGRKHSKWDAPPALVRILNTPAWPQHLHVSGRMDVPSPTGHESARYIRAYGPDIKFDPLCL